MVSGMFSQKSHAVPFLATVATQLPRFESRQEVLRISLVMHTTFGSAC